MSVVPTGRLRTCRPTGEASETQLSQGRQVRLVLPPLLPSLLPALLGGQDKPEGGVGLVTLLVTDQFYCLTPC